MPAVRLSSRRRRSSLGYAALGQPLPRAFAHPNANVTFAPNVTPTSYSTDLLSEDVLPPLPSSYSSSLFPEQDGYSNEYTTSASGATNESGARRRVPPSKRRSQGYIPRPPNAFMLFRADFVRRKHVPGSLETTHGSLSKIIGSCWRSLPLDEKRIWEIRAKHAKAEHKKRYPDYRFKPVHNKNKGAASSTTASASKTDDRAFTPDDDEDYLPDTGVQFAGVSAGSTMKKRQTKPRSTSVKKPKKPTTPEEERRCEEVAALLLQGKKGAELAQAVRELDEGRVHEAYTEEYGQDPSLGYPLSHDYAYASSYPSPSASSSHQASLAPSSVVAPEEYAWAFPRRPSSVPLPEAYPSSFLGGYHPYSHDGNNNNAIALPSLGDAFSSLTLPLPAPSQSAEWRMSFSTGGWTQSPRKESLFGFSSYGAPSFTPSFNPSFAAGAFVASPPVSGGRRESLAQRQAWGSRRSSSAGPMLEGYHQHFQNFGYAQQQQNWPEQVEEELPEPNAELFNSFSFSAPSPTTTTTGASPFDPVAPHEDSASPLVAPQPQRPDAAYSGFLSQETMTPYANETPSPYDYPSTEEYAYGDYTMGVGVGMDVDGPVIASGSV